MAICGFERIFLCIEKAIIPAKNICRKILSELNFISFFFFELFIHK